MLNHFGIMLLLAIILLFSLTDREITTSSPHHDATHLLDEAQETVHHFETEQKKWVIETLEEIDTLADQVKRGTIVLNQLVGEREAKKKAKFLWFFDNDIQLSVDEVQLKINDQERVISNQMDDIRVHWKQLKALYGIRSRMFFSELVASILDSFAESLGYWIPPLSFSFVSLLLLGPVALLAIVSWMALGALLLPYVIAIVATMWAIRLPFLIIQYDPTLVDFVMVYSASVTVMITLVCLLFSLFGGTSQRPSIRRIRVHED